MTFWPFTIYSDFPADQTFHQFYDLNTELDLHRIMSGFYVAFATGVACKLGTLTLLNTWFRPPLWDLLMLQLLRPDFPNLPCLLSTYHLEYPSALSRFCLLRVWHANGGRVLLGYLVLSNPWLAYVLILSPVFPNPVKFLDSSRRALK